jgi:cell wall-associated NlpC family hydrolase
MPSPGLKPARLLTVAILLITIGSTLAGLPRTAGADPVTDLSTTATVLLDHIRTGNEQITALGQQYDRAQLQIQQAQDRAGADEANVRSASAQLAQLQRKVDERRASDYRAELAGQSLAPLQVENVEQLLVRTRYSADQAAQEGRDLSALTATQRTLAHSEADAEQAVTQAQTDSEDLATIRQALTVATAAQVQTLSQIQGALATLLPGFEERQAAADLAVALAQFAPGAADNGDPNGFPGLPPVSPQAGIAIAFARAQLNKPYLYAATGPDSYDCSGLVLAAYRFAGVSLPHYSGAQYALLPHIPFVAMQPGDLIFWGPGGSEHVAIYVGAGRILEAGGTGNNVHIGPIWGHPVGAARVV